MKPRTLGASKRLILKLLAEAGPLTTAAVTQRLGHKSPGPVHLHLQQLAAMGLLLTEKPAARPEGTRFGPTPTLWRVAQAPQDTAA